MLTFLYLLLHYSIIVSRTERVRFHNVVKEEARQIVAMFSGHDTR